MLNPGTYYVGYQKISNARLNVGYDVNTNSKNKIWYNAVGVWENPSAGLPNGSLMIRPVFGTTGDPISAINENSKNDPTDFNIYPNPTTHLVNITAQHNLSTIFEVEIFDIYGKNHLTTTLQQSTTIDVSNFSKGIYFVRIINKDKGNIQTKKLIIQ